MMQLKFLQFPENAHEQQYLFACHPHGVFADYRFLMDGIFLEKLTTCRRNDNKNDMTTTKTNIAIQTLAATVLFWIPFVREIALWTGCIDARRHVADASLRAGNSIFVIPGGEAEQILTQHGREILYLQRRMGFLRLAMKHRIPVIPVYVFGASDYYHTNNHNFLLRQRMWLMKRLQICIPMATGMYGSPFCPIPVKTTVVFGAPLSFDVPVATKSDDANDNNKNNYPTDAQVQMAHDEYIKALTALFDQHKHALGYGERTLEIE